MAFRWFSADFDFGCFILFSFWLSTGFLVVSNGFYGFCLVVSWWFPMAFWWASTVLGGFLMVFHVFPRIDWWF